MSENLNIRPERLMAIGNFFGYSNILWEDHNEQATHLAQNFIYAVH